MSASLGSYAGDLDAGGVWKVLEVNPDAILIDVRSRAEWTFVGLPDLRAIGKTPILIEWQVYPLMAHNEAFDVDLQAELNRRGAGFDTPLYFICRSGARSQSAAAAAASLGYTAAYNVAGGFEGPLGPDARRGSIGGWKAVGLPWIQS
jgi:rhodanese-related sulfurtransferase